MIEFPITLTSGGSVCLPGRAYALALGYTKNRGVYRLAVTASGEWEGLAIRCFWHVPDGKDPASSLVDGYVDVPASVTAQPGSGCITFEGSDGAKVMTSADLRYRVSANSGTEDGTEPEPGTPAWQQLVDAVHADATAAEQAKTDAQTAAQQSGASAKKAGQALSDTITAKEDALKAIGDKQTAATQAVDTARDKALQQVEASTEAAQTAASEAATSAGNADQSAQEAAGSLQELKDGIASGNFKGEPGTSPTVTVQDIAGGHRIVITDATGTSFVDVLNGKQGDPGKPGDVGATPELTIGTVKEGDVPSATITGTAKNPVLNLTLKSGAPGKDATVDTTLTHEGEAADAKATGDAISAVKSRQNSLVGTETGNPLSVDDAFAAPLCGLAVYGRSTQDGTPTPDAPVPIVSAGESGSVTVKVTGKNLLNPSLFQNNKYQNFNVETGYYEIDNSNDYWITGIQPCLPNTTYHLNVYTEGGCFYDEKKNVLGTVGFEFTVKTPAKCAYYCANFSLKRLPYGSPVIATVSESTTYSPYREQLLTLPTPTGLPGIPVTSGGNYTDQSGQQWVCDEVDFGKSVKVQRVGKTQVNTKNGKINEEYRLAVAIDGNNGKDGSFPCIISVTPYTSWTSCVMSGTLYLKNVKKPDGNFYTAEELKALALDVDAVYQLATPIETPLTPDEIAAYKGLATYGPDTVVQAGDGAGVKLDYQRDVNLVVKNLEDAIASMT